MVLTRICAPLAFGAGSKRSRGNGRGGVVAEVLETGELKPEVCTTPDWVAPMLGLLRLASLTESAGGGGNSS